MDTTLTKQPTVTVILPVYNGGSYLATAINSVLVQTYTNFELLIIDDGSTDNSVETIKHYTDPRIRLVIHTENKKLIATLNEGLSLAQGIYIARIDSDDIWTDTQKLEKQITFLESNSEYALIGTQAFAIDNFGTTQYSLTYPTTDKAIRNQMLFKNCFVHSSVVFKKSIAQKANGFSTEEKHTEDYGLWLRIGEKAKFANLTETAVAYRINTQGITQQNNKLQLQMTLTIIKKHKQNYPNYLLGSLKWHTKLILIAIIGTKTFEQVKRLWNR